LQATGLADWAALHLQGHDFDLGMRLLQAFVQASCRFLTLHLPSLSSGETHFIFRNKFCSYTATSTFTGVAVFSVGSAGEFRITLVTAAILQEMAQWAIGYIINTTGFNFWILRGILELVELIIHVEVICHVRKEKIGVWFLKMLKFKGSGVSSGCNGERSRQNE
jgi:hypothetical protein